MNDPQEVKSRVDIRAMANQLVAAFQPLNQAFAAVGDAVAKTFSSFVSFASLVAECERLEAECVAQEERERRSSMARITRKTWQVVLAIVALTLGWWP
jgi:hypothetical protein